MSGSNLLTYYSDLTTATDPRELSYLYEGLPNDLPELCRMIKCQLIHPSAVSNFKNLRLKGEDQNFSGVFSMLEELLNRNPEGLIFERKPEDRLVISCRFHSLLLISILRMRSQPCRLRVGFASYLYEDHRKHVDHWVVQVWDNQAQSWIFVDPDLEIIQAELPPFIFAADAWLMAREGETDPRLFGVHKSWGLFYIRNNLCHDTHALLGNELRYGEHPPICSKEISRMSSEEILLLDELAMYILEPDMNFEAIQTMVQNEPSLQYIVKG